MIDKSLWYGWNGNNFALFSRIYSAQWPPEIITSFAQLDALFAFETFPLWLAAMVLLSVLHAGYMTLRGKSTLKRQLRQKGGFIVATITAYVACAVVVTLLKDFFQFPRPYHGLNYVSARLPQEAADALRSFPSGHAAFTGFLVVVFWGHLHWFFKSYALLLLFLVCISRVAMGVHFPMDVISGALIAALTAGIVISTVQRLWFRVFR